MLVSHKLKLIFVHIPKNAGTFIYYLLKQLDKNLVVIYNYDNVYKIPTHHNRMKSIKQICHFDTSKYLTFCVIRNPIDRIISLYFYIKGNQAYPTYSIVKNLDFKEFVEYKFNNRDFLETNYINQEQFIYDDDNQTILVNKVIRFENLKSELLDILSKRNVNTDNISFDKINTSNKKNIEINVEHLFLHIPQIKKEMLLFNYNI